MTEDEAKTKWCPFVRVAGSSLEWHTNRPSHADVDAKPFDHCIASACMAWRWMEDGEFKSRAEAAHRRDGTRLRPEQGFCGLASREDRS